MLRKMTLFLNHKLNALDSKPMIKICELRQLSPAGYTMHPSRSKRKKQPEGHRTQGQIVLKV